MERTYRIRIAAELSGVSEGLIRAWERRYGVLKPKRTASGYRSYTGADIEVLKALKKLTLEGVAIADAVKLLPAIRKAARGAVFKLPQDEQVKAWHAQVLGAAEELDQQTVEKLLGEAMAALPPVDFFEQLLVPLLREVGQRWHAGAWNIAQEHLVSQSARQCVLALIHQAPRRARHHVVCACFPEEDHELALLGVALRFRHAGWRVTFLGARTPAEHLGRVARALKPELVALSAIADLGAGPFGAALRAILASLPEGSRVVIGGSGALQYRALVEVLGVQIVEGPEAWEALLA